MLFKKVLRMTFSIKERISNDFPIEDAISKDFAI